MHPPSDPSEEGSCRSGQCEVASHELPGRAGHDDWKHGPTAHGRLKLVGWVESEPFGTRCIMGSFEARCAPRVLSVLHTFPHVICSLMSPCSSADRELLQMDELLSELGQVIQWVSSRRRLLRGFVHDRELAAVRLLSAVENAERNPLMDELADMQGIRAGYLQRCQDC